MNSFLLAVGFLTIIPVRTPPPRPGDMGRAAMWYPLVGFGLGLLLAMVYRVFGLLLPSLLAAALTVSLWALLTGGLHLDGLADCCDGLLATATPERRLEIMRDPRLGSFGVIGLILFLMLKVVTVSTLPPSSFFFLPFTSSLSRWLIVPVALRPSARLSGMGVDFKSGLTPPVIVMAALVPAAWTMLGLIFQTWSLLIAVALAHLVTFGIIVLTRVRLGGVTGDVFGLTVELGELAVLLTFAARLP